MNMVDKAKASLKILNELEEDWFWKREGEKVGGINNLDISVTEFYSDWKPIGITVGDLKEILGAVINEFE